MGFRPTHRYWRYPHCNLSSFVVAKMSDIILAIVGFAWGFSVFFISSRQGWSLWPTVILFVSGCIVLAFGSALFFPPK